MASKRIALDEASQIWGIELHRKVARRLLGYNRTTLAFLLHKRRGTMPILRYMVPTDHDGATQYVDWTIYADDPLVRVDVTQGGPWWISLEDMEIIVEYDGAQCKPGVDKVGGRLMHTGGGLSVWHCRGGR